jgi:hypothetical protein
LLPIVSSVCIISNPFLYSFLAPFNFSY